MIGVYYRSLTLAFLFPSLPMDFLHHRDKIHVYLYIQCLSNIGSL